MTSLKMPRSDDNRDKSPYIDSDTASMKPAFTSCPVID